MKPFLFLALLPSGLAFAHSMHAPIVAPLKPIVIEHENIGPLEIIEEGHPTLRLVAEEVSPNDLEKEETQKFLDDLAATMRSAGGVGIAAPQVNVSKRIFAMGSRLSGIPLTWVINPEITYLEEFGQQDSREGCLSIPRQRFVVPRYKKLHIDYTDRFGESVSEEVDGFKAIVIQHEYDHLEGRLISDFAEDVSALMKFDDFLPTPQM